MLTMITHSFCAKDCVDRDLVKGKIVLCDEFLANKEAYKAGAVGSIVLDTFTRDVSFVFPFPVSSLSLEDYNSVKSYVKSDE